MLLEATRILPDDTWLSEWQLAGSEMQLTGYAGSASALVNLLEQSKIFRNTTFQSPVVQDSKSGRERFHVATQVASEETQCTPALTPRSSRALALGILAALLLLAFFGLVSPIIDAYRQASSSVEQYRAALEHTRHGGNDLAGLRAELARLKEHQASAVGFMQARTRRWRRRSCKTGSNPRSRRRAASCAARRSFRRAMTARSGGFPSAAKSR